jgi:hypothetical protein
VSEAKLPQVLLVCGAIEAAAWGVAWFFDWSVVTLVLAVGVSTAVAGVILQFQRRKPPK